MRTLNSPGNAAPGKYTFALGVVPGPGGLAFSCSSLRHPALSKERDSPLVMQVGGSSSKTFSLGPHMQEGGMWIHVECVPWGRSHPIKWMISLPLPGPPFPSESFVLASSLQGEGM